MDEEIQPARLLAAIREEFPQVYELALRRCVIERQREIITQLHAATLNDTRE